MQKKSLFLVLSLAFSATVWVNEVATNGTSVSLEANKAPISTVKNPQAITQLPANLHLAVLGKLIVTIAGLSQPPLIVFADDNKTLIGSGADIMRLVAGSLGLEPNAVPTPWEDWSLDVTSGKYGVAISNVIVTKVRKEKFDFATYRKDFLNSYVETGSKLKKIEQAEGIAGLRIIVGSRTNQEAILLAWNDEDVKKGLQSFTPMYTKDDAAQTLALQLGHAGAYFGPNVVDAWKTVLNGKARLVGSVDGGWPRAAHIAMTLKRDNDLVLPVRIILNGVIGNGNYDEALNYWGEGVGHIPQSEINPAGLND